MRGHLRPSNRRSHSNIPNVGLDRRLTNWWAEGGARHASAADSDALGRQLLDGATGAAAAAGAARIGVAATASQQTLVPLGPEAGRSHDAVVVDVLLPDHMRTPLGADA